MFKDANKWQENSILFNKGNIFTFYLITLLTKTWVTIYQLKKKKDIFIYVRIQYMATWPYCFVHLLFQYILV